MRLQTAILAALLACSALPVTLSAAQASGSTTALVQPAPAANWTPDKKNPYSRLFQPSPTIQPSRQPATALPPGVAGKPEIKCGMTVIPADPSIDPQIAISRPPDGTRFTIRAIDPPICR